MPKYGDQRGYSISVLCAKSRLSNSTASRWGTRRPYRPGAYGLLTISSTKQPPSVLVQLVLPPPIVYSPHIVEGNALQIDWSNVVSPDDCDYIMGKPAVIGYAYQTKEQKQDVESVAKHIQGYKTFDYVSCWYVKAMHFMQALSKPNHEI